MKDKPKHKFKYKISPECLEAFKGEGLTQSQIAQTCGMSRQAIHRRLTKIYKTPRQYTRTINLVRKGFHLSEIIQITGKKITTIRNRLRRILTKEEYNWFKTARHRRREASVNLWRTKCYTPKEIAQETTLSCFQVRNIVIKQGPHMCGPFGAPPDTSHNHCNQCGRTFKRLVTSQPWTCHNCWAIR